MDKSKGSSNEFHVSVCLPSRDGWMTQNLSLLHPSSRWYDVFSLSTPVNWATHAARHIWKRGRDKFHSESIYPKNYLKKYQIKSCSWICSVISDLGKIEQNVHLPIPYPSSTAQGVGGSFKNRKPIGEIGCRESPMAEQSTDGSNCPTV